MQTNTQWETLTKNFTLESLVKFYLYRKRNYVCWYIFCTDSRQIGCTQQRVNDACSYTCLKTCSRVSVAHKKMYKWYFRYLKAFAGNIKHLRVKHRYRFRAENSQCTQIQISSENNLVRWCKNPFHPCFGSRLFGESGPGSRLFGEFGPGSRLFGESGSRHRFFYDQKFYRPVEK